MSAPDSNRVGAPDSRYSTLIVLNTLALPYEIRFYGAKLKLQQFSGLKGLIRKM
jgi:hypothetical protein